MIRSLGILLLALVLSGVAGMAALIQLGVIFGAETELVAMMLTLVVLTLVTTVALGIGYAVGIRTGVVALALLAIVLAVAAALGIWSIRVSSMEDFLHRDVPVLLYLVVPSAVMILIQWLLIRRLANKLAISE